MKIQSFLLFPLLWYAGVVTAQQRPNIILIMADDMRYSDNTSGVSETKGEIISYGSALQGGE